MFVNGMIKKSVSSIAWQDYRSSNTGMILTYKTDPVSELPIREVPEEFPSEVVNDPCYETATYGLYGCDKSKFRGAFFKNKNRYLFFLAKYDGTREDFRERFFVTGYYRIKKTADVLKLHLRHLPEASCIDEESCIALLADEVHFVALDDAFEITEQVLASWNYKARISRQTRFVLNTEQMKPILDHLQSKPNITEAYIAETRRLLPEDESGDGIEDELEMADPAAQSADVDADGDTLQSEAEDMVAESSADTGSAPEEAASGAPESSEEPTATV